jgi:hypothetical protein
LLDIQIDFQPDDLAWSARFPSVPRLPGMLRCSHGAGCVNDYVLSENLLRGLPARNGAAVAANLQVKRASHILLRDFASPQTYTA